MCQRQSQSKEMENVSKQNVNAAINALVVSVIQLLTVFSQGREMDDLIRHLLSNDVTTCVWAPGKQTHAEQRTQCENI